MQGIAKKYTAKSGAPAGGTTAARTPGDLRSPVADWVPGPSADSGPSPVLCASLRWRVGSLSGPRRPKREAKPSRSRDLGRSRARVCPWLRARRTQGAATNNSFSTEDELKPQGDQRHGDEQRRDVPARCEARWGGRRGARGGGARGRREVRPTPKNCLTRCATTCLPYVVGSHVGGADALDLAAARLFASRIAQSCRGRRKLSW